MNGHGGNSPATALLSELVNELPGLKVGWYSWRVAPSVTKAAESAGLVSNHAAWIEAFPFCRVAELPVAEPQHGHGKCHDQIAEFQAGADYPSKHYRIPPPDCAVESLENKLKSGHGYILDAD